MREVACKKAKRFAPRLQSRMAPKGAIIFFTLCFRCFYYAILASSVAVALSAKSWIAFSLFWKGVPKVGLRLFLS